MRFLTLLLGLMISLSLLPLLSEPLRADTAQSEQEERAMSDALYQKAQAELARSDYSTAIETLEAYVEFTQTHLHRPERVFWAINQIGHVYLGVRRDPASAIRFFQSIRGDARLTDLDRSAIDEWISVAEEWKTTQAKEKSGIVDADQLFVRGSRFYNSGLNKEKMGGIGFARADYDIASDYLRRFALLHDKDPRIGEVLFMLGKIRWATRVDPQNWSDNFYLMEVIRRFPHTELARRSYDLLRKEIDETYRPRVIPEELSSQLSEFEELSRLHVSAN